MMYKFKIKFKKKIKNPSLIFHIIQIDMIFKKKKIIRKKNVKYTVMMK